jgi:hypothetical protein
LAAALGERQPARAQFNQPQLAEFFGGSHRHQHTRRRGGFQLMQPVDFFRCKLRAIAAARRALPALVIMVSSKDCMDVTLRRRARLLWT